jgi:aminoglycoside phosphotransferase (APT) family kinase protein
MAVSGWDNVSFRLGENMSVRLPTSASYAGQVDKEHRWLPLLSAQLPLPIPEPLARGEPGFGFPWPWSVYRWLSGTPAAVDRISDLGEFGSALGAFLAALHRIDPAGAPPPSHRNFLRAGPLESRDKETRGAIAALDGVIDTRVAAQVWDAALAASGSGSAVWIHGDVSPSNLLVVDGRLAAVIDFGCSGVGDAAFDTEIAWGFLCEAGRVAFRASLGLDEATWARARGWKLWGSLPALVAGLESDADWLGWIRDTVDDVLADHESVA